MQWHWFKYLESLQQMQWHCIQIPNCQAQVQVQVPGQVQKVQGLRTKDLDLGYTLNLVCHHPPPTTHHPANFSWADNHSKPLLMYQWPYHWSVDSARTTFPRLHPRSSPPVWPAQVELMTPVAAAILNPDLGSLQSSSHCKRRSFQDSLPEEEHCQWISTLVISSYKPTYWFPHIPESCRSPGMPSHFRDWRSFIPLDNNPIKAWVTIAQSSGTRLDPPLILIFIYILFRC